MLKDETEQVKTRGKSMDSRTVNVETAAKMLGISRGLAYELVSMGKFPVPVIRLGRRLVVPREPLDRLLRSDSPTPHIEHGAATDMN